MFSSSYFAPEYFNEYFKVTGSVTTIGGGHGAWYEVDVNQDELRQFNLKRDDEVILEFMIAFVLSQGSK